MIKYLKDWTNEEIINSIIDLTGNRQILPSEVLSGIKEQAEELKKRLQPRIQIEARDWHDRQVGNYYHSTRVYIDRGKGYELIGRQPFSWGSVSNDCLYKQEAYELLVEAGVFPKVEEKTKYGDNKGWVWFMMNELRGNRSRYDIIAHTVRRKKDL